MTQTEIDAFIKTMEEDTNKIVSTKEGALKFLVELGTHDKEGNLTSEYNKAYKGLDL